MTTNHDRDGLEALATDVPEPRRTDDAFARSVADDIAKKRAPRWAFLPAVAAGAAAITMAVVHKPPHPATPHDPVDVAVVTPDTHDTPQQDAPYVRTDADTDADASDDEDLADADDDFALPGIDGSDEQELLAFEAQLDQALERQKL